MTERRRARAGGETVAGKFFKGGQFISSEALAAEARLLGVETKFEDKSKDVIKAVEKAAFENFRHAAASIRKDAIKSIRHRKDRSKVSPAGEPPTQHRAGFFKRAIFFDSNEEGAVIGFVASRVDQIAATHEHGLTEEGRDYPERPTMGPALERAVVRMNRDWRMSIG